MENCRDQVVSVETTLGGGGGLASGTVWGDSAAPWAAFVSGGGWVGVTGLQWTGGAGWWRDPRPGRQQGHPPSGASPPGKGVAQQEQLRSESPGSSRCTAGSPLTSHGPRQPRPVPWPGAREGRAWQGNPEHHAGQGPGTRWPFPGRRRETGSGRPCLPPQGMLC